MSGGIEWSDREIDVLFDMWSRGNSDEQIADALPGRSATAIGQKRVDVGACLVRPASGPSPMRRRCLALRQTHTASQIAAKLGITRNAVIGHWHRDKVARERAEILAA